MTVLLAASLRNTVSSLQEDIDYSHCVFARLFLSFPVADETFCERTGGKSENKEKCVCVCVCVCV